MHLGVVDATLTFEDLNVVFDHYLAKKLFMECLEHSLGRRTSLTKLYRRETHLQQVHPDFVDSDVGVAYTYVVVQNKVEQ